MSTPTHIGAGHTIVGVLRAGEDLTVSGRVQGRIESEGVVIVEAGAIVEADIRARELIVRGVVVGDVAAVESVEVTANGQLLGGITTRRILMRAGGRILGDVATGTDVPPFAYPERRSTGSPARRTSGPAASESRPAFSGRASSASTAEGARSWIADHVTTAPATAPARRPEPTPEPAPAKEDARATEPVGEKG
ncbi:MAG: hypothetical protein EP329_07410 [Deltaproteobacteria bacterium]|nr:MAG: hypothetical protein EP329_07410 [Deltaproteobacteria bacterium]